MTIDFEQLGPAPKTAPYMPRPRPPATASPVIAQAALRVRPAAVDRVDLGIPAAPPPEVLVEIAAAATRARELAEANRELHFRADEGSGRIVVEVRDFEGRVVRTIPPSHALDVMAGLYGVEPS